MYYLKKFGLISLKIIPNEPKAAKAIMTLIIFCFPAFTPHPTLSPIAICTPHRMIIANPPVKIRVIMILVKAPETAVSEEVPSDHTPDLLIHLPKKGKLVLSLMPPLIMQVQYLISLLLFWRHSASF